MAKSVHDIRLDDRIRDVVDLALEQGWEVTPISNNTKLRWRAPDKDVDLIITATTFGLGHDYRNAISRLKRAGLVFPNQKQEEVVEVAETKTPIQVDDVETALIILNNFVRDTKEADGWKEIAESHEAELVAAKAAIDELEQLVNDCRMALTTLAPWESMPRLADLLGVSTDRSSNGSR